MLIMSPRKVTEQQQRKQQDSTDGLPKIIECYEPTYATEPDDSERFSLTRVKTIANDTLREELEMALVDDKWIEDWADFGDDFESLSKVIADKVKKRCKETICLPRFKILVQVTIGQRKDQGVSIASRCLWDTNTDNYASASYRNEIIWASCIVFGVYTE